MHVCDKTLIINPHEKNKLLIAESCQITDFFSMVMTITTK